MKKKVQPVGTLAARAESGPIGGKLRDIEM